MGDEKSLASLVDLLRTARPNVRLMALDAMALSGYDPKVRGWLEEFQSRMLLLGDAQHAFTLAFGWLAPSEEVRPRLWDVLRAGYGPTAGRHRLLRRLLAEPTEDDLEQARALFPLEGELGLNLLLAQALADKQDPHTLSVLRRVLWGEGWNLSVIAGGVASRFYGIDFLMDELASPPAEATDHHLRRVGFALGEWGGLAAVEELARTQTARDAALQGAYLGALSSLDK